MAELGKMTKKSDVSANLSQYSQSSDFGKTFDKKKEDVFQKIERMELRIKELIQENAFLEEKTRKQKVVVR